jgi:surfeit locus 1 family protein
MMRLRPLLWPTLFTVPAILVLIGLGTWQLQRLEWKLGLIANIESRTGLAPIPLPANATLDAEALEYRPVAVRGRFRHASEMHLIAASRRGNSGYQVITPLDRADGGTVLINRGWVPKEKKDPASRPEGQVAGEVAVTGLVRKPWHQGWFVPDNNAERNIWFFGDAAAMARHAGIEAPPLFVEADATANPGGLPLGGQTRLNIPNDHLGYALTWYGFAVVLAVIYVVYHRREGRLG